MANQTFNQSYASGHQQGSFQDRNREVDKREFNLDAKEDNFEKDQVAIKTIQNWIKDRIDTDTVKFSDRFGDFIADKKKGISNSQIRNIFGEMRRIQSNGFNEKERIDFILLKPKMAYIVKRFKENERLETFYRFFSIGYDVVANESDEKNSRKYFGNLMCLMEAVLAFHKYHGGKE